MNPLKRITVKTLFGSVPNLRAFNESVDAGKETGPKVTRMDLFLVEGRADSYKLKDGTFGTSYAFKGENYAINMVTGEDYVSGIAFFPRPADEMLKSMLDSKNGQPVNYAFRIFIIPHSGDKGYEYGVEAKIEGEEEVLAAKRKQALERFGLLGKALPGAALPKALTGSTSTPPEVKASPAAVEAPKSAAVVEPKKEVPIVASKRK